MVDYCFSQKIEASIQTLGDCLSQVSQPKIQRVFELFGLYDPRDILEYLIDLISEVAIHEDDPLIEDELLGLEFNLNGLKHLDRLQDVLQSLLTQGCASQIMTHYQTLHCPLYLNS